MSEKGWFSETFVAIDQRLKTHGVLTVLPGEWKLAEMPELQAANPTRGHRPYGMVDPVGVREPKFTNKTKYVTLEMIFEVHADSFEELDNIIVPKVTAALQHPIPAGMTIGDGTVKITNIRPGDCEYEKVEQIWTARQTFFIQANQPAAQSNA
jgi:hypothetical protein